MRRFSIHTADSGELLGFLTLLADPDRPESGHFAFKPLAGRSTALPEHLAGQTLLWRQQDGHIVLLDGGGLAVGMLRQEHLTLCGGRFLLNDLTGTF